MKGDGVRYDLSQRKRLLGKVKTPRITWRYGHEELAPNCDGGVGDEG
jgi:hypothetical protein